MNEQWMAILASCASSAMGVSSEPPVYAPLRLLEVLERLLRFGEELGLTHDPRLLALADRIAEGKYLSMEDPEGLGRLAEDTALSLVEIYG